MSWTAIGRLREFVGGSIIVRAEEPKSTNTSSWAGHHVHWHEMESELFGP